MHENTHGTSNRLTGGGTGRSVIVHFNLNELLLNLFSAFLRCLQTTEAGGMGEGWSDAFAEWTEQTAAMGDFTMGR